MKWKILGSLVCTLLIATAVLPVAGSVNVLEHKVLNEDLKEESCAEQFSFLGNTQQDNDWLPQDAGNNDDIYHMGKVGIGTTDPLGRFDVTLSRANGVVIGGSDTFNVVVGGTDTLTVKHNGDVNIISDNVVIGGSDTLHGVVIGGSDTFNVVVGGTDTLTVKNNHDVILNNGKLGIGAEDPEFLLDVLGGRGIVARFSGRVIGEDAVNDNEFVTKKQVKSVVTSHYTPTGTSDSNGEVGDTAWDSSFFYVKTNQGWKRAALETWETTSLISN